MFPLNNIPIQQQAQSHQSGQQQNQNQQNNQQQAQANQQQQQQHQQHQQQHTITIPGTNIQIPTSANGLINATNLQNIKVEGAGNRRYVIETDHESKQSDSLAVEFNLFSHHINQFECSGDSMVFSFSVINFILSHFSMTA